MLGEAFIRILNPESAIDALERAYTQDPDNGRLRLRIGRTLVATHEYHRAVDFYEKGIKELNKALSSSSIGSNSGLGKKSISSSSSLKFNDLVSLSHDLAKLFIKLGINTIMKIIVFKF
jgi:tetratricopeptide (TPR) repeat protein